MRIVKNSDFSVSARIVNDDAISNDRKYYLNCLLGIVMES
jgi:hypothetical protein